MTYVQQLEEQNEKLKEQLSKLETDCIEKLATWKPKWVEKHEYTFNILTSTEYVFCNKITSYVFVRRNRIISILPIRYNYKIKFNNEIKYCCDKMFLNKELQIKQECLEVRSFASVDDAKFSAEIFMNEVIKE